uniref:5'-AMP-activated protein kinase subunit gamma-1 n=1 Tax=Lygus hesperus TaxID=30085 RepID=A0A0A9Z5F4_LYGHE
MPLYIALHKMLMHHIETIAVCDEADMRIIDVISQGDLLHMENQGVYNTTMTVRSALTTKVNSPIYVFYQYDSLREIFTHFIRYHVCELFLVDHISGKLCGQLNVS